MAFLLESLCVRRWTLAALFALALFVAAQACSAADIYLASRLSPSGTGGTAAGYSAIRGNDFYDKGRMVSADGQFLVFTSMAPNMVAGQSEGNAGMDVFIYDRLNDLVTLVSHKAGALTTSGNDISDIPVVSADGNWVAFRSKATDLVTGQSDSNAGEDFFLWSRASGAIVLVSHAAGSATTAGNGVGQRVNMSADGAIVCFTTKASNLVAGVTDGNANDDLFVFERSSGNITLASHAWGLNSTAGSGGRAHGPALSDDGRYIAYQCSHTNMGSGSDTAGNDVFLYDRNTNSNTLVSHAAGSGDGANGTSSYAVITPDGSFIVYVSTAINLVSGQVEGNADNDVFLYACATNTNTLVSRSAASATTTGNGMSEYPSIDPSGTYVAFQSWSSNLVTAQSDSNAQADFFLFNRTAGTVSLVSHVPGAPATAGNGTGWPIFEHSAFSADGRYIVYGNTSSNLVSGVTDTNNDLDVFLYDRQTDTNVLVSHSSGSLTTAGGAAAAMAEITPDAAYIFFGSDATNHVAELDANAQRDVFTYTTAGGAIALISKAGGATNYAAGLGSGGVYACGMSDDGRYFVYLSASNSVLPGVSDTNNGSDVFLHDRTLNTIKLISHTAASTTSAGNGGCDYPAISADGNYVVFLSSATNLISGQTDGNAGVDAFLWNRSADSTVLISHAAGAATTAANNTSSARPMISSDGAYVLYASHATNLVSGQVDNNAGQGDLFLYSRASGTSALVTRSSASAVAGLNNFYSQYVLSADGNYVAFSSQGSNHGFTDVNGGVDVFVFSRASGTLTLVSHTAGNASAASGNSSPTYSLSINATGQYVVYSSFADDLASGQQASAVINIFLWDRTTNTSTLISHAPGAPNTPANGDSYYGTICADGSYLAFNSMATNIVSGQSDSNGKDDIFLYNRASNSSVLVSHVQGQATTAANGDSRNLWPAIAANGSHVAFSTAATNVLTGMTDTNNGNDVYFYLRASQDLILATHALGLNSTAANGASDLAGLSSSGEMMLLISWANNLTSDDRNASLDVYIARLPVLFVGDTVFDDINNNGLKDAGENAISGVTVNLWRDVDSNNSFDPAADLLVGTTTTDGSGIYRFTFLAADNYILQIPQSNFNAGGPLAGYLSSTRLSPLADPNNDPDPDTDIDHDDNGDPLAGQGIVTAAVSLVAGAEPVSDGDNSAITNYSVDFGFSRPADLRFALSVDNDEPLLGNNVTFTLTVVNDGPSIGQNIATTATLPAGLNFVSASPPGAYSSSTGVWTIGNLNNAASSTLTIVANAATHGAKTYVGEITACNQYDPDSVRGNGLGEDDRASVVVTPNAPPTNLSPGGPYTIVEGASLTLSGSATDPDNDPITYTWDVNGDGTYGDASGANPTLTWAQLNALGISDGPTTINTFRMRASDSKNPVVTSAATTLAVQNANPLVTAGPFSVPENGSAALTGSATDVGGANDPLSYVWDLDSDGNFGETGAAATRGDENAQNVTFSAVGLDGPSTVVVTLRVADDDGGSTDAPVTVNVTNAAPVITEGVSVAVTMSEDASPNAFSLTLNATDAGSDTLTWNIAGAASNGTASASGVGVSKAIGYVPNLNYNGSDSFVVSVEDGQGGSDSITVNLSIAAVNDAPAMSVPGAQAVSEGGTLIFSSANGNPIVVSDFDAGGGDVQLTLTASNGSLNLGTSAGLTMLTGDGTANISLSGTVSACHTALEGLSYSPLAAFNGTASLQLTCDDQGNTGTGGTLSATQSIAINVAPELHHFELEAQAGGTIGAQIAGVPFNVKCTARAGNGAVVTSFGGTVTLSSNAGLVGAPLTSASFSAGVLSAQAVSLNLARPDAVLSVSASGKNGQSVAFEVRPGSASTSTSTLSAVPGSIVANGVATATVSVQLKDAYQNNLTAGGSTLLLSSTLGTLGAVTDNANGTYSAVLTAGTTAGNAVISGSLNGGPLSNTAAVILIQDLAPVVASQPSATPNPARTGELIAFSVGITDPENGALTYLWEFGDGSTSSAAIPTHFYSSSGLYSVSLKVTDMVGNQVSASVTVDVKSSVYGGGTGTGGGVIPPVYVADTDGDGFSDSAEEAAGTNPQDAADTPLPGVRVETAEALEIGKLKVRLKFSAKGQDRVRLRATFTVPEKRLNLDSRTVIIDFGGAATVFQVAGRQATSQTASLVITRPKSNVVTINFNSRGDYQTALAVSAGMTNADVNAENRTVPLIVIFSSTAFVGTKQTTYSARRDGIGTLGP